MKEDILRLLELAKEWNSNRPAQSKQPFSIIPWMYEQISSKELLHSGIIAELLRPDGAHDCGKIFLHEFMHTIGIEPKQQDFSDIKVITESPTVEGRRIDILIVWGNNAVIIENKLNNAVDQPNQLKDYLKDTENKAKKVLKIVYMPLYAWRKSHESCSAEVAYLCPLHLSAWLDACAQKSTAAHDVVLPYIQLLDYMNQSNQNYMKAQELYEILKRNPDLMDAALNIADTINGDMKRILREKLYNMIKNRFNSQNIKHDIRKNTSELWMWFENYKYWVSIDVCNKYYIYLYFDDEAGKPDGEILSNAGCGHSRDGYYYMLWETYRIGDELETENLITKVVRLLEKSRK